MTDNSLILAKHGTQQKGILSTQQNQFPNAAFGAQASQEQDSIIDGSVGQAINLHDPTNERLMKKIENEQINEQFED